MRGRPHEVVGVADEEVGEMPARLNAPAVDGELGIFVPALARERDPMGEARYIVLA